MVRLNCHHHGACTYIAKTYSDKTSYRRFISVDISFLMIVVKPKHVEANQE